MSVAPEAMDRGWLVRREHILAVRFNPDRGIEGNSMVLSSGQEVCLSSDQACWLAKHLAEGESESCEANPKDGPPNPPGRETFIYMPSK